MFKNQTTFDDKKTNVLPEKAIPEKDLKVEDIIIHTMAKDIQEQEHPTTNKQPAIIPTVTEHKSLFNEKQKNSPFLTPELLNNQPPVPVRKESINLKKEPVILKEAPVPTKEVPAKQSNSVAVTLIAIIAIALIAGAGVYYFSVTRQSNVAITEPSPETIIPTEPIIAVESKFSSNHPNYMPLDIDNLTSAQIKELLNNYAEEIKTAGLNAPAEFVITDLQNNPIDFAIFSQKIGITLSKKILGNLQSAFSLFIFNDNGNMRLGLAILIIDNVALKSALLSEEPFLAKNLEAILLFNTNHKFLTSAFEEAIYNTATIRYQNIVSPEELSVDYALVDNQLLFGTTKTTMHAIIDKVMISVTP
jgi:hypothetical protein